MFHSKLVYNTKCACNHKFSVNVYCLGHTDVSNKALMHGVLYGSGFILYVIGHLVQRQQDSQKAQVNKLKN